METSSVWAQYPKRSEESQQAGLCSLLCHTLYREVIGSLSQTDLCLPRGQAVPEHPGLQKGGQVMEKGV